MRHRDGRPRPVLRRTTPATGCSLPSSAAARCSTSASTRCRSRRWCSATPTEVVALGEPAPTGVDAQTSMLLRHAGGAHAVLTTTSRARQRAARRRSSAPRPGSRSTRRSTSGRLRRDPARRERAVRHEFPRVGRGMRHQAAEVARCLAAGLRESPVMPLERVRRCHADARRDPRAATRAARVRCSGSCAGVPAQQGLTCWTDGCSRPIVAERSRASALDEPSERRGRTVGEQHAERSRAVRRGSTRAPDLGERRRCSATGTAASLGTNTIRWSVRPSSPCTCLPTVRASLTSRVRGGQQQQRLGVGQRRGAARRSGAGSRTWCASGSGR